MHVALRLLVAGLGGLAVGIEREWSMKRGRHEPHFAGTRTFLLLGVLGALGAEFIAAGPVAAGIALLAAGAILIVIAYAVTARRHDVGGTTEVAALLVLAGGVLAGTGRMTLASALFAMTTLILVEKSRFHGFVSRIERHELMAAVRFAVLALVIFPLLPTGPWGPPPGFRPRELWILVLLFSGLSFISFLAMRLVGLKRGYGLVGLLGGLVSSTAVALNFSNESRRQPKLGRVLALGVIAACTVLPVRVILLTSALHAPLGRQVLPYMGIPFAAGLAVAVLMLRRTDPLTISAKTPENPLRLTSALQMAAMFQVVLYIMDWAGGRFGASGTLISAGFLGLTDVDALLYSMAKFSAEGRPVDVAAQAIAIGVLANTGFKLSLALALGRGAYRPAVSLGLGVLAAAGVAALLLR